MAYLNAIQCNAGLDLYVKPKEGHTYVLTADVSRGTSNDYSAFLVFDVSEMPYRIVAKYRDNEIKPLIFPQKIYDVAQKKKIFTWRFFFIDALLMISIFMSRRYAG